MNDLGFFSFTVSKPTGDKSIHFWQAVTPWVDWRAMGPDMRAGVKKKYTPYLYAAGAGLVLLLVLMLAKR